MSDTLDEIYCPACGKKMEKILLQEQGFYVDICLNGCGGMFFDNREFKKVDKLNENIPEIIEALYGKTFQPEKPDQKRICPSCGHDMVKNNSGRAIKVEIDECYTCGGIFLDGGEFFKIKSEDKPEDEKSLEMKAILREKFNALREKINNAK